MNRNYVSLTIALLGALKLILAAFFGIEIPEAYIDAIANGVGAALTVAGIVMLHVKQPRVPDVEPSLPKRNEP